MNIPSNNADRNKQLIPLLTEFLGQTDRLNQRNISELFQMGRYHGMGWNLHNIETTKGKLGGLRVTLASLDYSKNRQQPEVRTMSFLFI